MPSQGDRESLHQLTYILHSLILTLTRLLYLCTAIDEPWMLFVVPSRVVFVHQSTSDIAQQQEAIRTAYKIRRSMTPYCSDQLMVVLVRIFLMSAIIH